ncbi:MAG: 30S ribosomal protein S5 [bacterium]|nr:30S ribosomal protein S5 [bacterium]
MARDYSGSQEVKEFEEKVVQVNRVSKKTKGGNRMGFSVVIVVGDKKGRVGVGLGKAPDVASAIKKGANYAKKHLIEVPMKGTTIPHEIFIKLGASKILLKPAPKGTGVIAGGPARAVLEAAGVKDVVSKILGTNNQASNVYATLHALSQLTSGRVGMDEDVRKPILKKKENITLDELPVVGDDDDATVKAILKKVK